MEKENVKKSRTKKITLDKEGIKKAFIEYSLENGKNPNSIYTFSRDLGISEAAFYDHYNNFLVLEQDIWKGFMEETLTKLVNDPSYAPYSSREKFLALYFTMAEVLKANRSYILLKWPAHPKPGVVPSFLKDFKEVFKNLSNDILNEGKESGEVIVRPYISEKYDSALWLQCLFILQFWVKDQSKAFEATDAAIEKSVNLAFDLIGQSPLDSIIDFGKFLFQQRS
jgi:hypothetical protein